MLHYEQVFGDVFKRTESKCCAVLMKLCRNAKGQQMIVLQMFQQLKTKNINDDQHKCQSVKDTDNEFTECQTPRTRFQSRGISPVSSNVFTKTFKSNISEV